jgi:hypothetical protein
LTTNRHILKAGNEATFLGLFTKALAVFSLARHKCLVAENDEDARIVATLELLVAVLCTNLIDCAKTKPEGRLPLLSKGTQTARENKPNLTEPSTTVMISAALEAIVPR